MNTARIQWTGDYLQQAIADEIELAKAMGYTKLAAPTPPAREAPVRAQSANRLAIDRHLPRWRRDWVAGGDLIEELGLSIRQDEEDGTVSVGVRGQRRDVTERYTDHPDKGGCDSRCDRGRRNSPGGGTTR